MLEQLHRGLGRTRPDDLHADALHALERLAPGDEDGEHEVAERPILEQQRSQHVAIDRDVAQRLGDDRRDEHRLSGQQVQLADEPRRPVADDLVAGGVTDRDLALDDRDERVAPIANAVEHLTDIRRALLADLGKLASCDADKPRTRRLGHATRLAGAARLPEWLSRGARHPGSTPRR